MMNQRNENRILEIKSSIGISSKEIKNQLWQSLSKSIIDCRSTVIHSYFLPFIGLNWATQFLVPQACSHSVCENGMRDLFLIGESKKEISQFQMVLAIIY